eukprot:NODE_17436_length_942_cov_5.284663.p2 GENE.NODE_17436_length_942_cov_5.284663~~NODE_17436_length_942_cov_5.284663.p2  ORF type:complete len:85 (-),score=16.47 NODE_17436_length_942_cov_5.284663:76-330(-)
MEKVIAVDIKDWNYGIIEMVSILFVPSPIPLIALLLVFAVDLFHRKKGRQFEDHDGLVTVTVHSAVTSSSSKKKKKKKKKKNTA